MLHVATMLWDVNALSERFSRCYDESWVEKLYRGFKRNLTAPFRFVVFTDKDRTFSPGIEQRRLRETREPSYACCIEPFRLNEPSIIVGLDTIVVGNVDHLAAHCLSADRIALPRISGISNNGVVLVPQGQRRIFDDWHGENDMVWLRKQPHDAIDDLWPGQVVSYKLQVRPNGMGNARIVYFHGTPKMPELTHLDWINEHWR